MACVGSEFGIRKGSARDDLLPIFQLINTGGDTVSFHDNTLKQLSLGKITSFIDWYFVPAPNGQSPLVFTKRQLWTFTIKRRGYFTVITYGVNEVVNILMS